MYMKQLAVKYKAMFKKEHFMQKLDNSSSKNHCFIIKVRKQLVLHTNKLLLLLKSYVWVAQLSLSLSLIIVDFDTETELSLLLVIPH